MASRVINQYRAQNPALGEKPDYEIAREIYESSYSDIEFSEFADRIGLAPLDRVRAENPEKAGADDLELATELYQQSYSDLDFQDFANRIGVSVPEESNQAAPEVVNEPALQESQDRSVGAAPSDFSELPNVNRPLQSDRADARGDQERMTIGEAGEALLRNLKGVPSALEAGAAMGFGSSAEGAGLIAQQFSNTEYSRRVDNAVKNLRTVQENYAEAIEGVEDPDRRAAIEQNFNDLIADREADLQSAVDDWSGREPNQAAEFFRTIGDELQGWAQSRLQDGPASEMNPVTRDLATGTGSFLTYVGPGVATNLLTRGAPKLTRDVLTYTTSLSLASTQGVSDQYQRAIGAGLSEEEAVERSIGGIPGGAVQVAPVASILRPLPVELRGKALGQLATILRTAGSEALAESSGVILQNLVERSYNPERGVWDDSLYNAAIGGGVGGIVQLGIQLATRGRGIGGTGDFGDADPLDGIEIRGPETETPGRPSDPNLRLPGAVIDQAPPSDSVEGPDPEPSSPQGPGEAFEAIDREIEQIRRDVIGPSRDPSSPSPSPEALDDAEQRVNELLEQRAQLTPEIDSDQLARQADVSAPAEISSVNDIQEQISENQRQIALRRSDLERQGLPTENDAEIDRLTQDTELASSILTQAQERAAEQSANEAIDAGRAPVNDALGRQVESARLEAEQRSPLQDEIQRLRQRVRTPSVASDASLESAPEVTPEVTLAGETDALNASAPGQRSAVASEDSVFQPIVRANGQPFSSEASVRRSAPFRNAVNPEIVPVGEGFGFIERGDQNEAVAEENNADLPSPGIGPSLVSGSPESSVELRAPLERIQPPAQGQSIESATESTQNNVVTPMRNPRDEARYQRSQISQEMAYQMGRLIDLESQQSPFNRSRIEQTRRTIDGLAAQREAIDAQYPDLAGSEQRRVAQEQAQGFSAPDSFTEAMNQALDLATDDFWLEDLSARIEEQGDQAVTDAVNDLEEVVAYGVTETLGRGEPNQFEREIIRQRAQVAVEQAVETGEAPSFPGVSPDDAVFSRSDEPSAGLSADEAMGYVDGLMSEWTNAPGVIVAQSEADLPAGLQSSIARAKAGGQIRGAFYNGQVYVIADNASSRAEVEEVIFHEIVRHYGMRQVLGENYGQFMDDVYKKVGRRAIEPFAAYTGLDLDAKDAEARRTARRLATEELLAHTTEEELGSRLWTRLINAVTEWLRRMGFRIQLTGAEIRDVLQRAKMYVQDGEFVTGTSVVEKSRLYRGEEHLETEDEAVFARSADPAQDIKDRGPVKSPRGQNYVGVSPAYTIRNPRRTAPNRALILSSSNANNADAQSRALDVLLEKHPNPLSSERQWAAYANDAFGLDRLPMPPFRTIETINAGPSAIVSEISQLSDGMRRDAEEGLKTAKQFGEVYASGRATADITGKAFLWSFLSRGVSPYVQESAFLDAIMSEELTGIMRRAAADGWSDELGRDYAAWAENAIPVGSPGRGTQHNLNAFGRNFLRVMSQRHPDKENKTGLEIIHEMISEGAPSFEIRREFLKRGSGAGIDNKVVSFTLLLLGRDDVLVLDRVQIRNQFNDGRFDGQNIYDIKTDENGKQIAGSGFAEMTFGHKGLFYYEAMERGLKPIVEQAYAEMGMEGSLGRYHWDSWLLASNQEVGHASTEGLLREAQSRPNPYVGTFVRQGKYGNYDYGFRYGVLPDNTLGTVVEPLDGDRAFVLPREIVANPESETRRVLSRLSTKAKKRDTNAGKTKPWTAALTAEERAEYDRAIESRGTPAPDLWAYDPNAAGRADQSSAAAVYEGRTGRRRDTGESTPAGRLVVNPRGDEGRPEPVDGQTFLAAMQRAGETLGPIAAQVSTVPPSANVQRFLLDNGLAGYALDGDNLIGVFRNTSGPRGAAQRIIADAVRRGARRLDGFNTMLPRIYAKGGFRAVARLPFDPEYAPTVPDALSDWDAQAMEAMSPGWGSPDVVFMVYDPQNATAETQNVVSSYEEGVAAQYSALESQPVFSRRSDDPDLDEARQLAGLGGRRKPISEFVKSLQAVSFEKIRDFSREAGHAVAQEAFDRFHGIKRIEQRTVGNLPAEQSAYVAARLSTGIATVMRGILHYGTPQWSDGVLSRVDGSKGLLEILDPVRGEIDTFLGWMVARRASRLYAEGRENLFEPRHIEALLDAAEQSPLFDEFERVAVELDMFKKAVLDVAEEAGLIDPDARLAWDHSDYIPFYRIADDAPSAQGPSRRQALSGQTSGIRTLRGGVGRLNDPLENLIMNFTHLLDASMKNHAILQLRDNVKGFAGILEEVGPQYKSEMIPMNQVRDQIIRSGGDPSVIPQEAMKGLAKMWAMKPPADDDVIRVMDKGKARYYRVLDPLLLKSLTAIHDNGLRGLPMDFMRWTKRLLTRGVTADPEFMARNFIRDMMHAWTINEDKFRLGVDSIRGAAKTVTESGGTIDMMFAGGSFLGGYVNATDPREVARATRQALRQKGYSAASANRFMSTVIDSPLKLWEVYTRFGDSIENASREAVYEAARREGRSRAEAVFRAKDLMDYSMRGSNSAIQFFTDVVPFLNARLQGLYKLGRAGVNNPGPVLAKGSVIMLATLALLFDNKDDERYEELPDWDKDTYWHLFPPQIFEGMPEHIRIPKPFEIGVMFGTIPERIAMRALGNEDNQKTFERMLWAINSTFAFNPMPQAVFPMLEVFANRSVFTGAPIENLADQNRLPEARYSPYTSETMRALGQYTGPSLGLSPKELQHIWRGYTGTLGMYALGAADLVTRTLNGDPPKPAMRIDRIPVVGGFIRGQPAISTQFQTDLYDLFSEARQIQRTINAYVNEDNIDKAERLLEENERMVTALPDLRSTARELGVIRDEITQIYQAPDMTPEEKRDAIDDLVSLRNEITRSQVKSIKEFLAEDPLKE